MEFKFVDIEGLNEEELVELLDYNLKCAQFKRSEIAKLKKATSSGKIEIKEVPKKVKLTETKKKSIDTDFEEEIDYYLSEFRNLKDEELDTNLDDVLPVHKNYNYKRIIMRIIAELNKDIKDINEIIVSDTSILSKNELIEYSDEIKNLEKRKELLKDRLKVNNDKKEEINDITNTLIFTPTQLGNIRIFEDLKNIPSEYYPAFYELFQSIKDGSFKGIKRFTNNDILKGTLEVRGFKVRVAFYRLDKNTYALITAFIKKTDNDKGYRRPLEIKVTDYKNNLASTLKESIKNPEFIEENKNLEIELFRMLGEEDIKQKEKAGDK